MERDGAVLIKEVSEGIEVVDFSGSKVEILGNTYYLMAPIGCDQLKSKKFFLSSAITDDELLIGLSKMKSWGVVGKDFPKPNIDSFMSSEDSMNAIKLKIACLEKNNSRIIE